MIKSGYMIAGFEILTTIIDSFLFSPNFNNNFSRESLKSFLENTCAGYIHCFGTNFSGRKRIDKFLTKEKKTLEYCNDIDFYGNSKFILDSSGYEISIGKFNKEESKTIQNIYYDFLTNNEKLYNMAFILDLPPGPNCKIFKNFNDVYKLNEKSYINASELSIKDKLIYVHHFRTPKIYDIYLKIMDENNLFNKFNYYAVGGMVLNLSVDLIIPCIIYTIPLVILLNRTIKNNRSELNFHVLGEAGFRNILFYELFKIHVKKKHNIDLKITYDSSGIFKALMIGRFIHVIKDDCILKLNIRSNNLNKRCKNSNLKVIDLYKEAIDNFSIENNFKKIELDNIYDPKTNTLYEDVRLYSILYALDIYSKIEYNLHKKALYIYKLYENKNYYEFNIEVNKITKRINNNRMTKKQIAKSNSVIKSLDMLTELDEEYCRYLIIKFLSNDEFVNLI